MSEAPVFTVERSGAWIHYAVADVDAGGGVDRRVAWLAPEGSEPPRALSLAESWALRGVYVFLGRPAPSDRGLLVALRQWLAGAPAGTRFAWLPDPSAAPGSWSLRVARVRKETGSGGAMAAEAALGAGGYDVVVPQGCQVALREEDPAFLLGGGPDATGAALRPPYGDPLPLDGPVVIPLRGADAGAVRFGLTVAGGGAGADPLEALDVGIRYYFPGGGTLRYPVLDLRDEAVALAGVLDPGDPRSARARLAFAPDTGPLPSYLRTVLGRAVTLMPGEGAGLRFLPRGGLPAPGAPPERLTLAPAGPFALGAGDAGVELLCGTSGTEYIAVPAAGATVRFVPGLPALAPFFDPDAVLGDDAVAAARLEPAAVTSWVAVAAPEPLAYYAQPRDAVLHGAGAGGLLDYFPVPAGSLPPEDAGEPAALPLAPYGGVAAASAALAAAFETEVLAPERRERVFGITAGRRAPGPAPLLRSAPAPGDEASVTAVTPGGYVATFSPDRSEWRSLVLARIGGDTIALESIDEPLRSALLTSGQFLVISDPGALATHLDAHARVALGGWTFDLHPDGWSRHGTILILKSCGRALGGLVADVGTWVLPDAFNRSAAATQSALEAIIDDARSRATAADHGADDPWARFVRDVVDDPSWNGWLALRCPVPPGSLPPALQDLAAGLEEDRFFAHHLGIQQAPVPPPGEEPGDSALFGLIAYDDPPRDARARDLSLQVTHVAVSFAGSEVRSFAARIALTMRRFLGAPASLAGSGAPPILLLDGALQRRGDRDVYVFRSVAGSTLRLEDRVLESVRIQRCELGSPTGESGPDNAADDDAVVTRFTFRGSLAFHPLPDRSGGSIDLFGYDALPFSGLALEMRFPPDAPRDARFRFDVSQTSFTGDDAAARPGSLPDRFPLRPRGMTSSEAGARPADLGWSVVAVPELDARAPGAEWLAVVFDLDLGTPGALADAAGLSAGLALAWSPSFDRPSAMVGLRLPGASNGAAGVSLMGVLDLNVHRQRLVPVDGGYLLKLTGLTLRFLGRSLPPDGTFDVLLFGDPQGTAGNGLLGWYGAYRGTAPESGSGEPETGESDGPPLRAGLRPVGMPDEEREGEDAPPPAWLRRPWAWTLIQTTEDGP